MTHEAAVALTAQIVKDTIQHMADKAGVSFEEALVAVTTTEGGKAQFGQYLAAATAHVRAA